MVLRPRKMPSGELSDDDLERLKVIWEADADTVNYASHVRFRGCYRIPARFHFDEHFDGDEEDDGDR